MKFSLYIALRYLVSRKKQHVINIISGIAVTGVTIGTAALIIILSVLNGFEEVTHSFLSAFDPQVKITPALGKSFSVNDSLFINIKQIPEIETFSVTYEENAILEYEKRHHIATVKGVDENFSVMTGIDTMLIDGEFVLQTDEYDFAVMGGLVANALGFQINFVNPVRMYVPRKDRKQRLGMATFNQAYIFPSGIFAIQNELDAKYVLVPLRFARQLFQDNEGVTAVEIKLKEGADEEDVIEMIKAVLGDRFEVKNRLQQHDLIYRTLRTEKWAVFLILAFIMAIASLNIISSLSMLIIDKKADIEVLKSMGAETKVLKTIFLLEGWLISFVGALAGVAIGTFACWLQQRYGLVTFPGSGNFMFDAYPVKIMFFDTLAVVAIVFAIGFLASWLPVQYISGKSLIQKPE